MKKFGLALGAGGAKGLAHISILKVFEELSIKPSIISGSSIGALLGIAFAAGKNTTEIEDFVKTLVLADKSSFWEFRNSDLKKIFDLMDPSILSSGIVKGNKFQAAFMEFVGKDTFEELDIPVKIVATDYTNKEMKIFSEGSISAPLKASYALPGFFPPVKIDDSLFIDGGVTNPVPYDIIANDCDEVIAIDILSESGKNTNSEPGRTEVVFASIQIMHRMMIREKSKHSLPAHLVQLDLPEIKTLEFNKAETIYKYAEKYQTKLKDILKP